jgi:ATP/maltotriose-dependent transcriptional regulator MalT
MSRGQSPCPAVVPGKPPGGLTAREAEVLALVAQGKTNREVRSADAVGHAAVSLLQMFKTVV